jgi:arylsulfatase A-like enzyme
MRGPGIPKDETRAELVNNLDVVATIAELAGVSPDYALDGHTLAPLFADANAPWRSALLIESPVSRFQRSDSRFTGVRTATLKYVRYDRGFEQLFDLRTDPYELRNEAGKASHARDLASLRSLNEALKSCTGASCFVP